jgi:hypothetical protein
VHQADTVVERREGIADVARDVAGEFEVDHQEGAIILQRCIVRRSNVGSGRDGQPAQKTMLL